MFFEGNEKKIKIIVSSRAGNLREKGLDFWNYIVSESGAQILSSLHGSDCDAYLLSESSLFVWKDCFLMITCGRAVLIQSVISFLKEGDLFEIKSLTYERKNEYFPKLQKSNFFQDAENLNKYISGKTWQLGDQSEHHLMLYSYNNNSIPQTTDFNLKILMYDLQDSVRKLFSSPQKNIKEIYEKTKVHRIFDGFEIDDYLFEPCGYSLNALRGQNYYTIHVTPQEVGDHVSFETNMDLHENTESIVKQMIEAFKPRCFDVIIYSLKKMQVTIQIPDFKIKNHTENYVDSGHFVTFNSLSQCK